MGVGMGVGMGLWDKCRDQCMCNEESLQDKSDFLPPYLENWHQIGYN